MKRMHIHVAVENLLESVRFYTALFQAEPSVLKEDYAKWMLDDPHINFAISNRGQATGVDHLGVQVDSDAELEALRERLASADRAVLEQKGAACCYAQSDKYWITDPQGVAWEVFHSLNSVPVYGEDRAVAARLSQAACCQPARPTPAPEATGKAACCSSV